jgi:hypothetical protein
MILFVFRGVKPIDRHSATRRVVINGCLNNDAIWGQFFTVNPRIRFMQSENITVKHAWCGHFVLWIYCVDAGHRNGDVINRYTVLHIYDVLSPFFFFLEHIVIRYRFVYYSRCYNQNDVSYTSDTQKNHG